MRGLSAGPSRSRLHGCHAWALPVSPLTSVHCRFAEQHRLERLLGDERIGEVRVKGLALRQALQELGERGDERVLVADDVAGPPEVAEDRDASGR